MYPLKVLALLLFINGTPPALALFFRNIANRPLDNNRIFFDGYPVLGKHKTIRGFLGAILAGAIFGYIIGFPVTLSLIAGLLSMLGDSFSSFIKRRFQHSEGTFMPVLDQIFEGGFPLLIFHRFYSFSWLTTLIVLLLFVVIAIGVSLILRKILSPHETDTLRLVRSTYRFREWRTCHTALSPIARYLNFENVIYYRLFMGGAFKAMGLYDQGVFNALDVRMKLMNIDFSNLPDAFNPFRILFISDLHIDGLDGLTERLIELVSKVEVDICLLGGDYRMEMYGQFYRAAGKLRKLAKCIKTQDGIFGILGNHDCLEIAPDLEDAGICMLINDSFVLDRDGESICIVGVDDPHYYKCHDMEKAFREVSHDTFSILLSHSPEILKDTDGKKIDLCLCGHTHGGQIRLPIIGPVFTHSRAPRRFASGLWRYSSIIGYTSNGAGSSGVPLRFNCPPEVVLITLSNRPE